MWGASGIHFSKQDSSKSSQHGDDRPGVSSPVLACLPALDQTFQLPRPHCMPWTYQA